VKKFKILKNSFKKALVVFCLAKSETKQTQKFIEKK